MTDNSYVDNKQGMGNKVDTDETQGKGNPLFYFHVTPKCKTIYVTDNSYFDIQQGWVDEA